MENTDHNYNPDKRVSGTNADNEILQEVIRDCTTIICCVGTIRITNIWTDFIVRPFWRLLRMDVSDWCNDPHHPYYVHYRTTQKILHYAEREQIRREAAVTDWQHSDETTTSTYPNLDRTSKNRMKSESRIRFIRISDLCVTQPPWYFIPILTNVFHSMVFRYQLLADMMMKASTHIDTITIRPGDIVDEERDSTIALQVDPQGFVPYPARVGREDTAELVVAAALFHPNKMNDIQSSDEKSLPFHYTLACRWVGNQMDPFPAQGHTSDGHPNAHLCLQSALRTIHARDERRQRRRSLFHTKSNISPPTLQKEIQSRKQTTTKMKPYGICVAIPVYMFLSLMMSSIFYYVGSYCPKNWTQWLQPMTSSIIQMFHLSSAFLTGHMIQAVSKLQIPPIPWILKNIRQCNNIQYISF
jgi:hypothetical protein